MQTLQHTPGGRVKNVQTGNKNKQLVSIESILESFPGAVVITDSAGLPIGYNQAAEDILGVIPNNLEPGDWPARFSIFQNDGKTYYSRKNFPLLRALHGEAVQSEEVQIKSGNPPELRWISISAKTLMNDDGKIIGALLYLSDITEYKQIEISHERKIKRIEAAYTYQKQITKFGNDPLKILNEAVSFGAQIIGDGCIASLLTLPGDKLRVVAIQHVNPSAEELLRNSISSQEYTLQSTIESVVRSGEPLLVTTVNQGRLEKVLAPNQIQYFTEIGIQSLLIVPIKGRTRVLGTLSLIRDRDGASYTDEDQSYIMDVAYRTGLAIDNNFLVNLLRVESSGRKNAQEALEQSEARFRSIFTSTSLGIKLLDLEGTLLETNPAFQQMMGYSEDDFRGNPLTKFLYPADANRLLQLLDSLKRADIQSFQIEHRLLSRDGSLLWVNSAFTGIKKNSQDESLAFIVGIAENITERKRIEAEMTKMKSRLQSHVELERLRLAQELHDGPLQDLYSTIYNIENWAGQQDTLSQEKIDTLKQELFAVIQGLRNTARDLRPPTLASFGLEKAIRSHAEEFNEINPELTFHLNLAKDGQLLPEDLRLILFRIYQHSIANILRHAQASKVDVNFTFDAEEARLQIHDDGIGFVVPTNWVDLVRQGHLGLAGAVERVSLLDGKFTVESTPGKGTTVCVVIPIPTNNEPSSEEKSED